MVSFYADYDKIQINITGRMNLCPLQNYYMGIIDEPCLPSRKELARTFSSHLKNRQYMSCFSCSMKSLHHHTTYCINKILLIVQVFPKFHLETCVTEGRQEIKKFGGLHVCANFRKSTLYFCIPKRTYYSLENS